MWLVILYAIITVLSVVIALSKKKFYFLGVPAMALFAFMIFKIVMVPMPFWETVKFIFSLR